MDRYVTSQSGDNRGTSAQSFKDDSKSLLFPESLETLQRGGGKRCRGGGCGVLSSAVLWIWRAWLLYL